eukprot:3859593-Amphidinium_carterae.1
MMIVLAGRLPASPLHLASIGLWWVCLRPLVLCEGWPHYGLPDVWNFDWVQMTPSVGFTRIVDIIKC